MCCGDYLVKTSSQRRLTCQNKLIGTEGQSPIKEINIHNAQHAQGLAQSQTDSAGRCDGSYLSWKQVQLLSFWITEKSRHTDISPKYESDTNILLAVLSSIVHVDEEYDRLITAARLIV